MTMILNKISRYRSFHSRSSSSSYRYLSTTTTNPFAPDPLAHTLKPTAKQTLIQFIQQHSTDNLALLSGAGLSTSSGIPDYRSEKGSYSKGHEPMQHSDFIKSPSKRKRFWARSIRGYKYFGTRDPNFSHLGFAALEQSGYLKGIVTQNVDRLHHAAGSQNVVELHGRGDQVACLSCDYKMNRRQFTENMEELNMDWLKKHGILEFQNKTKDFLVLTSQQHLPDFFETNIHYRVYNYSSLNRTTIKSLYRSMTMILNKISRYRSFHSRSNMK